MSKKKIVEPVMCDYYTKTGGVLKREYGEVMSAELNNVKGFNLPVHKNLNKLLK